MAISAGCKTCRECPSVGSCADAALRFLEGQGDFAALMPERQRIALIRRDLAGAPGTRGLTEGALGPRRASGPCLGALSEPVRSMVERLYRTGWYELAAHELRAGRNPGSKGWQRVLCDLLIRGGFTRGVLQLAFEQQLGLKASSAKVRVCRALQVFEAGELIQELNGLVHLRRN